MGHSVRAAVVVLAAILLSACGPTAAVTTTPNPTAVASTLPFADEICGGSQSSPCKAGTYRTRQFKPAFTFTVPAGWRPSRLIGTFVGGGESTIGISLSQGTGEIVITVPSSLEPPAPGEAGTNVPADLGAWLAANRNFVLGAAQAASVGGVAGQQLDGTVAADLKIDPSDHAYRLSDYLLFKAGQHVRFTVLKVGGAQLVLATVAAETDWDAFVTSADQVIASIGWTP